METLTKLKYHICFLAVSTYYCSGIDTCITLTTQPRYSRNRKPWHAKEGGKYLASLMSCHPLSLWICCASVIWCRGGWGAKIRFLYTKIWAINTIELEGDLAMILPLTKPWVADLPPKTKGQRQITQGRQRFIGLYKICFQSKCPKFICKFATTYTIAWCLKQYSTWQIDHNASTLEVPTMVYINFWIYVQGDTSQWFVQLLKASFSLAFALTKHVTRRSVCHLWNHQYGTRIGTIMW